MNFLTLLLFAGVILLLAYRIYGKFLEKEMKVDPNRVTPANEIN